MFGKFEKIHYPVDGAIDSRGIMTKHNKYNKQLYNNYSKTRNLIGQYPCRMRQSCTGNLKVDIASHFTSLLRA